MNTFFDPKQYYLMVVFIFLFFSVMFLVAQGIYLLLNIQFEIVLLTLMILTLLAMPLIAQIIEAI